ncbi:polysaccharide deacetylase family protein [Mesorhizobium sp.]|uniref:polysaccharide deacetylase family protein n=1 Tax=Mesorhizobium sp. TaxID=1871066 RepID=UPI0025E53974|nr:polysaccharide deacetylase family protein [Mesorhizobium sp.]
MAAGSLRALLHASFAKPRRNSCIGVVLLAQLSLDLEPSQRAMPIPILMYHQIAEPLERGSPFAYLTVDPRNFLRQMTWLKRTGWTGLSMRDLLPYLKGDRSGKVVGITFDDGFRNVYRNALPILDTFGFTATSYIVSRQIGGFNEWDAALQAPWSACMSRHEICEWSRHGHEIGAHTLDHVRLTTVAPAEARRQITDVRHELQDLFGRTVDAFCYPYGDLSPRIRDMVAEAGYTTATTIHRGRVRSGDDFLRLPRRLPRSTDGWAAVLRKCLIG